MILKEWINSYKPKTQEDIFNAKREIIQELALTGLFRAGFFEKACFYGGTALRIFYGLDRFSEDLDFSLLSPDLNFSLDNYFDRIISEFQTLGLHATISKKQKINQNAVESAFLKETSEWSFLQIHDIKSTGLEKTLKVKFEIDRDPPLNFETETKLLLRPYGQHIRCMTIDNLFAGKLHALLFRKWVNNEKGRDWYDFVWYVTRKHPYSLTHFNARATASNSLEGDQLYTTESLKRKLHERVENMNLDMALRDISRFIRDQRVLDIWSKQYFHNVVDMV